MKTPNQARAEVFTNTTTGTSAGFIPFNKPHMTGKELHYIADAHFRGHLAGDGYYTKLCHRWLEQSVGSPKALLTHSCTAALEMAAILAQVQPGDEVIMPSYTFVSTANAFALRGAIPIFVDIRPDTLNIDETKIEAAISERTKVIVPVHYAGVGCEMDVIMAIADRYKLLVVEDAAQGIMATYKGKPLGSIGHLAALSFHETKNIISGEGGALLVNDNRFSDRAEVIREKGTNRSQFFRGSVDKYTWCDVGSSYLPSDLIAAFLWAQMEEARLITNRRLAMWKAYQEAFAPIEKEGLVRRPYIAEGCNHNAHMYYLILPDLQRRTTFIRRLREKNILSVFHYVPLHQAPQGKKYGRVADRDLRVTANMADRIVRLPLWLGLEEQQDRVINEVLAVVADIC